MSTPSRLPFPKVSLAQGFLGGPALIAVGALRWWVVCQQTGLHARLEFIGLQLAAMLIWGGGFLIMAAYDCVERPDARARGNRTLSRLLLNVYFWATWPLMMTVPIAFVIFRHIA